MSSSHKTIQEIDELIANGRRIVEQANETLATAERFFTQTGIDPEQAREMLRRDYGDAAVEAIEAEVQQIVKRIEEEVERETFHAVKVRRPGRRPGPVRKMI